MTPSASAEPGPGEPRIIDIEASSQIKFLQNGEPLIDIPVTPGETVVFRVDNTAGFEHLFTIGTEAQLGSAYATGQAAIPPWTSGVQELEWTVPEDVSTLLFACTVPGHFTLMHGTLSVAP